MDIFSVISLLGGLAMFLYGMEVMGDGLKNASGSALKKVLGKATQNIVLGVITGMLVTAVIQSSTATIVLTVGLISAGILNLKQAVSIVMGANIGTTVTAQIIRLMDIDSSGNVILQFFKPETLAPVALIIGILLIMFIKLPNSKTTGEIFVGFGILFAGLLNMTAAVEPLSESPEFIDLMQRFGDKPFLALMVGLVLTVIIQSSSAMVGMIQALSVTGAMTFNLIYPMIMGINLGTCVTTALVCSIGSSKDAKRVGVVHIAFNVLGTILFMIVMELIKGFGGFPDLWQSTVNSGGIANFQTLFNLITAVVLVPFAGYLVKLSMAIVKPDVVNEEDKAYLPVPDAKLYEVPKLALSEAKKAIARMGEVAFKNLKRSCMLLEVFDERRVSVINENEDNMDVFTDSMDTYLVDLSKHVETDADSQRITTLMQTSTNFERIGDHAINIMEVAQSVNEGKLEFSQSANEEFEVVKDAVFEITTMAIAAFAHMDSDIARRIEPLEEVIDDMVLNLKDRHIERLKRGECTTANGMAFVEALTNLERIADQCSNVALLVLSESDKAILGNHHAYVRELHKGGDEIYNEEVAKRKKQYLSRLEQ
ncbi:MAG: Na/Pi cotransporter family protein [Candidatus Fimisoma sp.]|mgnify:CR=1 FL=1|nr:Na/Pi cotransporter family protein [Bacillota bacterium]MDY4748683.1 Na/Pi cotransporter family protein [Candidatus Fimisoma sp.]